MKNHSLIFDDFFDAPLAVKDLIRATPMQDIQYKDMVTYPNIVILPLPVEAQIHEKLNSIFGGIDPVLAFARYSFKDSNPPHWAHSDREIAEFLALIYLNDDHPECGTAVVRHIDQGFETHPTDPEQQAVLLKDANNREMWDITFECPARFNRCFILNADLVHASMGQFGENKNDGRLVISVFFNGKKR